MDISNFVGFADLVMVMIARRWPQRAGFVNLALYAQIRRSGG